MAQKLPKKNNKVQKIVKKVRPVVSSHAPSSRPVLAANITLPKGEYVEATGRRKVATARVRVYKNPGDFIVNGLAAGQYFHSLRNSQVLYNRPFVVTDTKNAYAVSAEVSGSGVRSQLDAVVQGISLALAKMNATYRPLLKPEGLLTRDDRMKETRKIGMGGKARRKRQSPKR